MNKGNFSLMGGIVAFGAALLMVAHPTPANTALPQVANAPTRTLHTNGSAVVRVQPDKVTLRLGVETFAATAPESQSNAARLIAAVTKAVRSRGIAPQDIATDYFAVRPEYDYNTNTAPRKTTGYRTNNTVLITLHQVNKLSDVLSAALEAGAISVDDVSFSTSRLRELRDQARTMAVKAALQKAQGLASAANAAAGDVQTIVDNSNWYYAGWGWNNRVSAAANLANMTQNVIQAQSGPGELPEDGEFSLGQIVVQAQIDPTVELK